MHKPFATILSLCVMSANANAASTICKVEGGAGGIKAIAWNEDNTAKVTDSVNATFSGRVTLKRKHNDGEKVNILIKYDPARYGADAAEYMVFPVDGQFRVIGVTYVIRDNEKFLNTYDGNFLATCLSL
jgi:hypothetical protein